MAVNWCFLLNRKNSSPGDAWADICCCKLSFVALTSKTASISASQALWESKSFFIMAVSLFNPHCMQATTGRLLTFSIVRWGSHSCGNCPVWSNLLRVVPVQREWREGPSISRSPAVFACRVPYGLVRETYSKKNLRVWLSIPIKKQWAKGKQLIQVFDDSVMSKGTFVAWKICGCPF